MKTNITRKYFESVSEFENWNDATEDKDNIVTIIEEGGWYRVDFTTWCARPSTAIRRMFAQLRDIKDFTGWEECMIESIQSNYWHMNDMTMGDGSKNPYPSYSWGVEQLWEKTEDSPAYWYVFINIMTDAERERVADEQIAQAEAEQTEAEQKAKAEAEQKAKTKANVAKLVEKTRWHISVFEAGRSAWDKGVTVYADELLDELRDAILGGWVDLEDMASEKLVNRALLNGAANWKEYSWGGCSLIYDGDIAERLCTPSELKKTRHGERRPNSREEWLDTQGRALCQAAGRVRRGIRYAIRTILEEEVA